MSAIRHSDIRTAGCSLLKCQRRFVSDSLVLIRSPRSIWWERPKRSAFQCEPQNTIRRMLGPGSSVRSAEQRQRDSGERRPLACSRRQLADDIFRQAKVQLPTGFSASCREGQARHRTSPSNGGLAACAPQIQPGSRLLPLPFSRGNLACTRDHSRDRTGEFNFSAAGRINFDRLSK